MITRTCGASTLLTVTPNDVLKSAADVLLSVLDAATAVAAVGMMAV